MRLEKYLADCGIGTRSQCKTYIRQGLIKVDGAVIKNGAIKVRGTEEISFQDKSISLQKNLYFMFHKPAGCICATKDEDGKTVLDYFPSSLAGKLLIAGRLDKDTEGLLFLTDNGTFIHQLMSPKKHVEKTYYFEAAGRLLEDAVQRVAEGIDIGDELPTKPGKLQNIQTIGQEAFSGLLTIKEGRYHQVKRMIKTLGGKVFYLKRISIGGINLDEALSPGEYRPLTEEELQMLGTGSVK